MKKKRICPVCGNNLLESDKKIKLKKSSMYGFSHMSCPFCGTHLKLAFDWKIIPLIVAFVLSGALFNSHFVFKVLFVLVVVVIVWYISNLPYKSR